MPKYYGYAGKTLRINLTKNQLKVQPTEKSLVTGFLGGRGFNSKILYDEVPKDVDPLSPQNKLVFGSVPNTIISTRTISAESRVMY